MKIMTIILAMTLSCNSFARMQVSNSESVCVTPTITAGAYANEDAVGGEMEFSTALGVERKTGLLKSIKLSDNSATYSPLELICFDRDFTVVADNGASTYPVADVSHISFVVSIAASDYLDMGASNFADISNIDKLVKSTDEVLRCQLKVNSNPTFNGVNELTVCVELQKDSQ